MDLSDFPDEEPSNGQQLMFPIDPKDIVESSLELEYFKNFNRFKRNYKFLFTKELQSLYKDNYISGAVIDGYMMSKKITGEWGDDIYFFPTELTHCILGDAHEKKQYKDFAGYNININFNGLVFLPYCLNNIGVY